MSQMYDTIVIGAGPSGLCAAKTILQYDPDAEVRILDGGSTVGGVWAKERLYPDLKTNNILGRLEFHDFPMHSGFGVKTGEHIPGGAMNEYLTAYARHWGLLDIIDFDTKVEEISRLEGSSGWQLVVTKPERQVLQCRKLMVATGTTNSPHVPHIKGDSDFDGPIMHSSKLSQYTQTVTQDPQVKTVAVLGGGKSAYDAVYLAANSGKQVEWIIRKSGKGPAWILTSIAKLGPLRVVREKLSTRRIVSFFSPCLWQDGFAWIRHFLHATTLGKTIAQAFWANVNAATLADTNYARDEKLKVLVPETSLFWYGTASGILNYNNDLFGLIQQGKIRIHREDIACLSSRKIHLTNDDTLAADVLILSTGYTVKPVINFPANLHSDLGIPTTTLTRPQEELWKTLDHAADATIVAQFPRLLEGPHKSPSSTIIQPYNAGLDPELQCTPFRLYRAIAPPGLTAQGDRSLVFIGMTSNIAGTYRLELQCLWACAYFNRLIDIDQDSVLEDTALMTRFNRHRSPYGHGRHHLDIVFDQTPYFDMLVRDLGLPIWRKSNIFREVFEAYGPEDFTSVLAEWQQKQKKKATKRQNEQRVALGER